MTEKVNSGLKRSCELHFSVSQFALTLIIKDHVGVTFKLKWRSEQSNSHCGRIRDITRYHWFTAEDRRKFISN